MTFSAIAAVAANRTIGRAGDLPWQLPEDMKFFREKTRGHVMIMGRKTFDSLPGGKPLPGRFHIVVSRRVDWTPDGATVVPTIEAAFSEAERQAAKWGDEAFVIGGGDVFALALPRLERLYLTEIHQNFEGDSFFPEWPKAEFEEIERRPGTEKIAYDFVTYCRRRS